MIVTEDTESSEVCRFFVVDAMLKLGAVSVGGQKRSFDPLGVMSFYDRVCGQLLRYSSSYLTAFRYVPRRIYQYLRRPPLLSDLCSSVAGAKTGSWVVDQFLARPLLYLERQALPPAQQDSNVRMLVEWTSSSPYASRFYPVEHLPLARIDTAPLRLVMAADLPVSDEGGLDIGASRALVEGRPLVVAMEGRQELDRLLLWLISLKEHGLSGPDLLVAVRDHRTWGRDIGRLADIPGARVLTCGATIASLSTLIGRMRRSRGEHHWSERLVFASAYPETHTGDSIAEVLSFLLSRSLGARPGDVQRVLAGNILRLVRPRVIEDVEVDSAVVAEGALGRMAVKESARVLRVLATRQIGLVTSVDVMLSDDGGRVVTDTACVTIEAPGGASAHQVVIHTGRDGTLHIAGWRSAFTEGVLSRDAAALATTVLAYAPKATVLSEASHLNRFTRELLRCIGVRQCETVLSALRFSVDTEDLPRGTLLLSPDDMRLLDVSAGDVVLVLAADSSQWAAGRVRECHGCRSRWVRMCHEDAGLLGLAASVVDVTKYDGDIAPLDLAVFTYDSPQGAPSVENMAWLHMHGDSIRRMVPGLLIGLGSQIVLRDWGPPLRLSLSRTDPPLGPNEVGVLTEETEVDFIEQAVLGDYNVVLCTALGPGADQCDVRLRSVGAVQSALSRIAGLIGAVNSSLHSPDGHVSRRDAAVILLLHVLDLLLYNDSDGRLGAMRVSTRPEKFVLHADVDRMVFSFSDDLTRAGVVSALVDFILGTPPTPLQPPDTGELYRGIAEYLHDFKERPTLVVVVTDGTTSPDPTSATYLEALSKGPAHATLVLLLGDAVAPTELSRHLSPLEPRVVHLDTLSLRRVGATVIDMLRDLVDRH